MRTVGIIILTALIPTKGHANLISFALNLNLDETHVIVCEREHEPTTGQNRIKALQQENPDAHYHLYTQNNAPQNPEDHPQFWQYWAGTIKNIIPNTPTHLITSETYGKPLSNALNTTWVPYDLERTLNPVKGSVVRENLWEQWEQVLPKTREDLGLTVTLFGQESVGKTTVADEASRRLGFTYLPEWARPYLEATGGGLGEQEMLKIVWGQYASQKTARRRQKYPVMIQDTDLYSTLGYYRITGMETPKCLLELAEETRSDHYYVLPDSVPFVPDLLRYGGDRRESDMQFWVGLLDEFGLDYTVLGDGTVGEKVDWVMGDVVERFRVKNSGVAGFVRE